ncbi:MAG TPA: tetraacyldisaccharide 4'-kinase, partial [Candidatus Brocadiales bacterium]|nr:tetraacyldisaccharide 4'-kinase [Candidatus Brocadiales bacterium]
MIVGSKHPVGAIIQTSRPKNGGFSTLYIPAALYGLILKCREFLYRRGILKKTKVPVPVISIGNITMGGTGKTPTVEFVARYLSKKGKKVVILSRGY